MRLEPGKEAQLFLSAAQFLTRLPIGPRRYDPDWLPRGAKYFPLVGILVACPSTHPAPAADRALTP